jgi:hypothetical protein
MIKRILRLFDKKCTLKFSRKDDRENFASMLPTFKPCSICGGTNFLVANQESFTNYWIGGTCQQLPVISVLCESCGKHDKFSMMNAIKHEPWKIKPLLKVVE